MGFLNRWLGPGAPRIDDAEELRQQLFKAAQAGDGKRVERLCRANRDAVREHFPVWRQVPEGQRDDRAAVERHMHALLAIAQTFAQRLSSQELMQQLIGSPQDNPLVRWQHGLDRARELMGNLRYPEARQILTDLLIDVRKLRGSGVDRYLPITLGYLGECYFQGGEADKAIAPLSQALGLCREHADAEGVVAYLGNLYEVHRYLGQAEPAAGHMAQLADAVATQGQADGARRYRRQAEIVRAGEPLNRVVAVVDGRRYELDEVGPVREGRVQFVFKRNRITLRPAAVLTERGEKQGSAGRFDEALADFRAAGNADPFDPHSRYEAGLTILHLGRYAEAVEMYEKTEELAPGWFHCRADLWLARHLEAGELGQESFLALYMLEDGPLPPKEKVRLAGQALVRTPHLALLHLCRGKNLAQLGKMREAQDAYRQGLAHVSEPDVKTRLLVELAVVVDDGVEKSSLFREAQALGGNLVAAATATVALKAQPAGR
jgi:tetratricopeptide (TPR) repeat protein